MDLLTYLLTQLNTRLQYDTALFLDMAGWLWGHCIAWCACLLPSYRWYSLCLRTEGSPGSPG